MAFYSRFTERAQRALMAAQREAAQMGRNYVGTEHLLLGVLANPGAAGMVLGGITLDAARGEILSLLGQGDNPEAKATAYTPRTKKVLELSAREAHEAIVNDVVQPGDVVVVRYCGPVGAPGMVEIMEATEAIVNLGLDESVALITDGRFSGFCHGPIVGHVSPEAALGGTIALIEEGDLIEIDIEARKLELRVPEEELARRREKLVLPPPRVKKGFMRTYADNCLPPERGAAMQKWL